MNKFTDVVSRTIAGLTIGLAVCSTGLTAHAQQTGQEISAVFRYDSANSLADNYRQIERVAQVSCRQDGPRSLRMRRQEAKCTAAMIDIAVAKIGVQRLAELHHAETGRRTIEPVQTAANGQR